LLALRKALLGCGGSDQRDIRTDIRAIRADMRSDFRWLLSMAGRERQWWAQGRLRRVWAAWRGEA
jgi:hypothetical protein